jgi:hypothetical protein
MSLVGLVNLAEHLSNQNSTESQQRQEPPGDGCRTNQSHNAQSRRGPVHSGSESPGNGSNQRKRQHRRTKHTEQAGPQTAQGSAGANGSFLYSAFNLQIEEVNLTLVNGNGQTAQIQASLPNATTNGAATIPAAVSQNAKAASA